MEKKLLKELQEKLEKQKKDITNQLIKFADKDEKLKGDWDTRFPSFADNEAGSGAMEQAAGEVEEYNSLLPVEHNLELELKNIDLALEKIKKGTYGICENCHQEIDVERLRIHPSARYCLSCKKST
jgi:DnaK suppressor protein